MKQEADFSLAVKWLCAVAVILTTLVISYLYLHEIYPGQPYFWLSNNGLMAEVIFWSLFGALSNVFISMIGATSKRSNLFDKKSIGFHSFQIVIAPFFAFFLFSAVFYLNERETFDKSFILLSFVAGLLSGHLLLLFTSYSKHSPRELAFAPYHPAASPPHVETEIPYGLAIASTIVIKLELDDAALFFDEKKELLAKGFESASVSIQKEGAGDIINASKNGVATSVTFIVDDVEKGKYTIRAMQSLKLKDNSVLNLFGEQEIEVLEDEENLILYLKKLAA
ncbi:MAG TPA: hypothetical protein PL009_11155 [Flavipsychrobacter sp.]|nr:hypothetical protein [Flavipsychrobacter sp.]